MATGIMTLYGSAFITATFYMKPLVNQTNVAVDSLPLVRAATSPRSGTAYAAGTDSARPVVQYSVYRRQGRRCCS